MLEIKGNLWKFHEQGFPVVITTNCEVNGKDEAIMGKGVALEAKHRFPDLPRMLGTHIQKFYSDVKYFLDFNLFAFPTKYNWREKANYDLISESAVGLAGAVNHLLAQDNFDDKFKKIYMVPPGCGYGHLDWKVVKYILAHYLNDRFIVVTK
jgi:hypothetical protein